MKKFLFAFLSFQIAICVQGQSDSYSLEGEVTFLTSENIYIRFMNTTEIAIGDTLFQGRENRKPCLQIVHKSSSSVVGIRIADCGLAKGDKIYLHIDTSAIANEEPIESKNPLIVHDEIIQLLQDSLPQIPDSHEELIYKENIRGRISASSYSSLMPNKDRHRMMTRFSLNANNINDSKLSFETYLNYRQNILSVSEDSKIQTKIFRVYNFALTYNVSPSLSLTLGRKINRKISSLGAIDGFQAEKFFGNGYVGVILGLRPDIFEFDINQKLLQYGAYGGFVTDSKKVYSETTFGILEQRNSGKVDRRYGYLQHSSYFSRKLNLFSSLEIDLFSNPDGISGINPRITSLYSSLRYRINKEISFMVSYDTRKRIIYYETLRTDVEQLLADDIARQGLRFRLNIKPQKNIYAGVSYSRRFQSDQQNKSDNINGFINQSEVPGIGGRLSFNYNWNRSNYLDSQVYSFRHSRTLINRKLDMNLYYRLVNYNYISNENKIKQSYFGTGFSYRLPNRWTLNILGEYSSKEGRNSSRFNTKIIKRFRSK